MELTLDPKVVEVINDYMGKRKIISPKGLGGVCSNTLKDMAEKVLIRKSVKSLVVLKVMNLLGMVECTLINSNRILMVMCGTTGHGNGKSEDMVISISYSANVSDILK